MPCPSIPFKKTAKTSHALLRHLRAKGLGTRGQQDRSLNALEFVGYHRLLIYMRPFQDGVCAHHGRLWNASITASTPRYANSIASEFPPHADRGRIFARAVVAQALLAKIDPASDWKAKFKALMATFPVESLAKAGLTSAVFGSPAQWQKRPFWAA